MMTRTASIAAALIFAVAGAYPAIAAEPIDGTYRDRGGYVEITVRPCGDARCAVITRIVRRKPGASSLDEHNDDPALRDRPILGLTLLSGLRRDGDLWRGRVYNPEDGNSYRAVVRPRANGSLEVEGCLAFICRSRIWPAA